MGCIEHLICIVEHIWMRRNLSEIEMLRGNQEESVYCKYFFMKAIRTVSYWKYTTACVVNTIYLIFKISKGLI